MASQTGEEYAVALQHLQQQLSVKLQRGNAHAVLLRAGVPYDPGYIGDMEESAVSLSHAGVGVGAQALGAAAVGAAAAMEE